MALPQIILASTSPRRKALLSLLDLPFEVVTPDFREHSLLQAEPQEEALVFAEAKARSVADQHPSAVIIGSDTLIEFQGEKIGKPGHPEAAMGMLGRLQGQSHRIWTSVFLLDLRDQSGDGALEKIEVRLKSMSRADIQGYVATGEPLDKAGGYAVQGQGRRFIQQMQGDFFAAMGLPLRALARLFASKGLEIPGNVEHLYKGKPPSQLF